MNVFELQAILTLDSSRYDAGLGQAKSGASALSTALKAGVTAAAAKAAGAIVDFGKDSIRTGMQFDSAMSQVAATMGTTTDQIGELRDFALEMGKTTVFSATDAAEALNYMALAGYDADTSISMLPNVLNLAAAGGIDLALASDMVTDAQSALGLSLDETSELVDKMAKTSSKTNTSVSQLGDAILTVGGTASYLKEGTTELAASLGILADNGIKGAEGGTHLRNMILSLTSPTEDAAETLNALGVEIFDAEGNMRNLADIFPDLNAAMSELTDQQKIDALSTIFNKTDLSAANALLGTSVDRWNELGEAIDRSAGAAERMAETQLDNLAGDLKLLDSATEGLQIAVSEKLSPVLRDIVQVATDGITGITNLIKGEVPTVEELTRSAQALHDAIKSGQEDFEYESLQIDATANVAERYIEKIGELSDKTSLSAEEHKRLHEYLTLLTDLIPETASVIDLETDSLNGGVDALEKYSQSWADFAREQLAQEYLSEVQERYTNALIESERNSLKLAETEVKLEQAQEQRADVAEEMNAIYDAGAAKMAEYNEQTGLHADVVANLADAERTRYDELSKQLDELDSQIYDLTKEQESLVGAAEKSAEIIEEGDKALADARETLERYTESTQDTGSAVSETAGALEEASEVSEAAAEATAEATEGIEELGEAAETSAETVSTAAEEVSGSAEEMEAAFTTAAGNVETSATTMAESVTTALQSAADEARTAGEMVGQGFAEGILSSVDAVRSAARAVADAARDEITSVMDIHSPARVTRRLGENTGEGFAEGIEDKEQRVKDATADIMAGVYDILVRGGGSDRQNPDDPYTTGRKLMEAYANGLSDEGIRIHYDLARKNEQLWGGLAAYAEAQNSEIAHIVVEGENIIVEGGRIGVAQAKESLDGMIINLSNTEEAAEKVFAELKDGIAKEVKYGGASLQEQIQMWTNALDVFVEDSKEYDDILETLTDLEYQRAKERERQVKDSFDSIEKAQEDFYRSAEEFQGKIGAAYAEIDRLQQEYFDAVENRTNALANTWGMFGEAALPDPQDAMRAADLIKNLEGQVAALEEYSATLDALAERGVSEDILAGLREAGPGNLEILRALNGATDEQLDEIVELYGEKFALAGEQAIEELETLKDETNEKISEQIDEINRLYEQEAPGIVKTLDDALSGALVDGLPETLAAAESAAQEILDTLESKLGMLWNGNSFEVKTVKFEDSAIGAATAATINAGQSAGAATINAGSQPTTAAIYLDGDEVGTALLPSLISRAAANGTPITSDIYV